MEVKPILPKIPKPGDPFKKRDAEYVAEEIKKTFEETTATWNHKPKFNKLVKVSKNEVRIRVSTKDLIYNYVVLGTKPHRIPTKGYAFMRFNRDYKSKTTPASRKARKGGDYGPIVFRSVVQHPGTDPRPFPEMLKKYWEKEFPKTMAKIFTVYANNLGAK